MKTKTFYYIGSLEQRMFAYPGAPIKNFKKGDSIDVPLRYVELMKRKKSDLFSDKSPSLKKEFKEADSITKPFTGGETKGFTKKTRRKK